MPKVELHVHIEGAASAELYWRLAQKNSIKLPVPSLKEWENYFSFRDFNHFIQVYDSAVRALKTVDDYYDIVSSFMQGQAEQNIRWTEAFLSLSLLPSLEKPVFLQALHQALEDGKKKFGIQVGLIGDISRHLPETQDGVLDLVLDGFNKGVFLGIGLGGIETGFPPQLFAQTWDQARNAGLKVFAHAGETTGPKTISDTVDLLHVSRVGHGITVLQDTVLTRRLSASRVAFEVCPKSNYATGVVAQGQPHPVRQMVDAGIFCTVNSDDPAMFSTSLTQEYLLLAEQGFSWDELWKLNLNAIEASSLDESGKSRLRAEFE